MNHTQNSPWPALAGITALYSSVLGFESRQELKALQQSVTQDICLQKENRFCMPGDGQLTIKHSNNKQL